LRGLLETFPLKMSLVALVFAPILFLYTLLRNLEMLQAVNRVEEAFDLLQAKIFSQLGFNLKFEVYKQGAVFITDCTTPVGSQCCISLAQKGFTVFAGALQISDAHKLKSYVPNQSLIIPVQLDITNQAHIDAALNQIEYHLASQPLEQRHLVGVLNTTGLQQKQPLETSTTQEWQTILNVNLVGPFAIISAFLPLIRQSKGRILNLSSFSGQTSSPMNGCFAASKIALENATDTLRNEVYPFGVSVSLIIPGAIDISSKYDGLNEITCSSPTGLKNSSINKTLYRSLEKTVGLIDREVVNNRLSPSIVTRAVEHALFSGYPKARYLVGLDAKLTRWLKLICSDRLLDWVGFYLTLGLSITSWQV
jgi:NAD(P)-dependent dehydrogenase (short-subunit alcohol dehydrogenase family)